MTSAEAALRDAVCGLPPVTLADLPPRLALQNRVDRKYLAPAEAIAPLLARLPDLAVLAVAGTTSARYESVYYDDAARSLFRAHRQRRRRRYKVRTRTYLDTDESLVEVKLKAARGRTVKERLPCDPAERAALGPAAREFVAKIVDREYGLAVPELFPAAITSYRRTTLLCLDGSARITCDAALCLADGDRRVAARPDYLLIETKAEVTGEGGSPVDRALRACGLRPRSMSKYALAIAALHMGGRLAPWGSTARTYLQLADDGCAFAAA